MSHILVDSSVWISFFKGSIDKDSFFNLIDTNQLSTNDLILSEIIPSLSVKKETNLMKILYQIQRYGLAINWSALISFQAKNLRKGINKVGIADLIIMQNAIDNNLKLYTLDSHFKLMSKIFPLQLYT
jgi:hypothetical protein